jgi:hypothetical protein
MTSHAGRLTGRASRRWGAWCLVLTVAFDVFEAARACAGTCVRGRASPADD